MKRYTMQLESLKTIWSLVIVPAIKSSLFVLLIIASFFLGSKWQKKADTVTVTPLPDPVALTSCSVSVNEKGELMIIDRATSKIYLYEQNVGMQIFKSYGNHMVSNKPQ